MFNFQYSIFIILLYLIYYQKFTVACVLILLIFDVLVVEIYSLSSALLLDCYYFAVTTLYHSYLQWKLIMIDFFLNSNLILHLHRHLHLHLHLHRQHYNPLNISLNLHFHFSLDHIQGHDHTLSSIRYSSSGDQVVTCGRDQSIKFWDVSTGYCVRTLNGHTDWVKCLSISLDGELLASGSHDQSIIVWKISTGQKIQV